MTVVIGQRELRNDNAEIIRKVEAGETFVITRHGVPVADLVPHVASRTGPPRSLGQVQQAYRKGRRIDVEAWQAERAADDTVFGLDDPVTEDGHHPGTQRGDS